MDFAKTVSRWMGKIGFVSFFIPTGPAPKSAFELPEINIALKSGTTVAEQKALEAAFQAAYEAEGPTNKGERHGGLNITRSNEDLTRHRITVSAHPDASAEQIIQSLEHVQKIVEAAGQDYRIVLRLPNGDTAVFIKIDNGSRADVLHDLTQRLESSRREAVVGRKAHSARPAAQR